MPSTAMGRSVLVRAYQQEVAQNTASMQGTVLAHQNLAEQIQQPGR